MPGQAPYQGRMSDIVGSGPDVSPQESPSGRAYKVFDPESDGYFERIGDHLNAERPLEDATKPPHIGPPQPTNANQAWVWHDDEQDWFKHSGSVTNRIDLLGPQLESEVRALYGDDVYLVLKGRGHDTYGLGVQGEKDRGYEIEKGPGGYYYSIPSQRGDLLRKLSGKTLTGNPHPGLMRRY
jgi:hypothetical protein